MYKHLFRTALGLMGLMGTLAIGVVNAETTISEPYGHIDYMLNENEPFEAKVITITDGTDTITILDRNLGAKKAGTGCESACAGGDDTYGYHFQRGNNYGFDPLDTSIKENAKSVSSDGVVWSDIYDNSGYYGTTFIKGDSSHGYDYWGNSTSSSSNHENLRGGGGDYNDTNNGFGKNNENRRGPCPEGFHVPSSGELQKLQSMLNAYGKRNKDTLRDKLLIPFAGFRGYGNVSVSNMGYAADLWSSSPYSASGPSSRGLGLDVAGHLSMDSYGRANALSVRCFYDEYDVYTAPAPQPVEITYDPNGGAFSGKAVDVTTVVTYTKNGSTYTPDINIQFPNKESEDMSAHSGWMFDGWYTTSVSANQTSATEWTGYVDENTQSQTVYAKWLPFNDLPIEGTDYILMDRNLGATDVWNYGDSETSVAKNGKYYQWGNNYGFSSDSSISPWPYTSNTPVDASAYGPGNYYSSATFNLSWSNTDNANLWGGNGDTMTTDGSLTTEEGRQGPCPALYHVPSAREWKAIYDALELSPNKASRITFQTKLHFPSAGYRSHGNSNVINQGSNGGYWSSTRSNVNSAHNLGFSSSDIYPRYGNARSFAFSVRCLKDSPTQTLTFNASENGGTTSATTVTQKKGTSVDLSTSTYPASKTNANGEYTFVGWNTGATAHEGLTSITLNEDKTVYAIFKKDLTATYTTTNASISGNQTSGSCTLWNKDTSCSITLPDITCNAGYHTPAWTPENLDNITADSSAIASCTANTYTVHFVAGEGTGSMNDQDFTYGVAQNLTANTFTKTGHIFSGWTDGTTGYTDGQEVSNLTTTNGDTVTLTAQWRANEHKLSFIVDGNVVQSGNVAYGTDISAPANPTKDCNSFAGWTSSVEGVTTTGTMPDSDVTFTATWNYTCSRSSGGGGSRKSSTATQDSSTSSQNDTKTSDSGEQAKQGNVNTQNSSSESQNDGNTQQKTYSEEFQKAYGFAHESGITTMDTIEKAEMDQPLTRIAMAKMLSQYAINVLGKKPANITVPKFKDVSEKLDTEYDNGVTLAYQLGIMGINMKNNEFRPFDYVTRAEFATALSRLLFDTPDGKDVYYSTHLRQLMEKKIITNDDPRLQELRGYVMIMLMRSAED